MDRTTEKTDKAVRKENGNVRYKGKTICKRVARLLNTADRKEWRTKNNGVHSRHKIYISMATTISVKLVTKNNESLVICLNSTLFEGKINNVSFVLYTYVCHYQHNMLPCKQQCITLVLLRYKLSVTFTLPWLS